MISPDGFDRRQRRKQRLFFCVRNLDGCFAALIFFCSKNLHFPRNSKPNLAQYISERPKVTSHGGEAKEGQTTNKRKKQNTDDLHLFRKHP
jgi:hypothetical protein